MNRWAISFILVGLLAAGLAYDQTVDMPVSDVVTVSDQVVVSPAISNPPRLDGAWFCPIGSTIDGGYADHQVNITNFGDDPAVANLSIITSGEPGANRRIELPPHSTERVKLSDTQVVEEAGAVVEITGGRGAVSHTVSTTHGVAEGPCATQASNTWYFAAGRTTRDSEEYLALMNPFPETAVFDIKFQAVGRTREPGPLKGAFVPARSVRLIRVRDFVSREEILAAKITTNRGRLVVERLQLLNGESGPSGAALQLGVPTPAPSWIFTAGRVHEGGDDLLTIYNPFEPEVLDVATDDADESEEGDQASVDDAEVGAADEPPGMATVEIELWPNNPTDLSTYSVVTIQREVRAGTFVTVDLRAQAERFEFPLPYELGVNVTSDGQPIVAERWQYAERLLVQELDQATPTVPEPLPEDEGDDLVLQPPEPVDSGLPQPTATTGISTSRGNELFSSRWVIPWVTMQGDSTLIAIAAIDEAAVEVRVLRDGEYIGPIRATVPAAGRTIVPVTSIEGAAVEITSDQPISVEASVVTAGSLDVVPAIPTIEG